MRNYLLKLLSISFVLASTLTSPLLAMSNVVESPNTTPTKQEQIKLWGVAVSPYVRKVRVILAEKNLSYQLNEVMPTKLLKMMNQEVPADFAIASPLGKIPALEYGDFKISDSAVIAAYLEKKHSLNPLYPKDPETYTQVLWLEKYIDDQLTTVLHHKIFMERVIKPAVLKLPTDESVVEKAVKEELPPYLDFLEEAIKDKEWLAGAEHITIADISLACQFIDLKMSKVELDSARWPNLSKHIEKILLRPSFVQTAQ